MNPQTQKPGTPAVSIAISVVGWFALVAGVIMALAGVSNDKVAPIKDGFSLAFFGLLLIALGIAVTLLFRIEAYMAETYKASIREPAREPESVPELANAAAP